MKDKYASDIKLGERYRDVQTGYEGVATALSFFQHACERVILETYDPERKELKEVGFDAPRVVHIETKVAATSDRPGGPARADGRRTGGAR